jgi:alpha-glucosidase
VGWTDPDCRRTFPWGAEDEGLVELHRELARIRAEHPSLRNGSFTPLGGGRGWIAYGRFSDGEREEGDCVAVACNNLDEAQVVRLRLRTLGIPDGRAVALRLRTTESGFDAHMDDVGKVSGSVLTVRVPAKSALVLCC